MALLKVTTVAGGPGYGYVNGTGGTSGNARFQGVFGVANDAFGNVYVAESVNHTIRKISPSGDVSTLAGNGTAGSEDGAIGSARFSGPQGVALDAEGNLYVADTGNHRIRVISLVDNSVRTLAGGSSGFADDDGTSAQFSSPGGLALDASGNVYVADTNNRRVRKITPTGSVTTLAGSGGSGLNNGPGSTATFNNFSGIAVDNAGNIYVADRELNVIRRIDGVSLDVSTFAGTGASGALDGTRLNATFNAPYGIAISNNGVFYVADTGGCKIRRISDGNVETIAGTGTNAFADGTGYQGGIAGTASFQGPIGIGVSTKGDVYVADFDGHRIRQISYRTKLDGRISPTLSLSNITSNQTGEYVCDVINLNGSTTSNPGTLQIPSAPTVTSLSPTQSIIAGQTLYLTAAASGYGNLTYQWLNGTTLVTAGTLSGGSLSIPTATSAHAGSYTCEITDSLGQKTTTSAVIVTVVTPPAIVTQPQSVSVGEGGTISLSVEATGTGPFTYQWIRGEGIEIPTATSAIYVKNNADASDVDTYRVRVAGPLGAAYYANSNFVSVNVTHAPTISVPPVSGNVTVGGSISLSVVASGSGTLTYQWQRGGVTTFAGSGLRAFSDGTGIDVAFAEPNGVAIDATGNVYVADAGNNRIRKITPGGVTSTLAGSGASGNLDGSGAQASFSIRAV